MSLIDNLNDNCFVLAVKYLVDLSREIEAEAGEKPSLSEMCELLTWGFRSCSTDILRDVDPHFVTGLKPVVAKHRKIKLQPGDLVAIPVADGGWYFTLYITHCRAGHAFGIFRGQYSLRPPPADWNPGTLKFPVYTGARPVDEGRWQVIAHRPDLLKLFPADPEFFFKLSAANNNLGPYGAAETASGKWRNLTKEEFEEINAFREDFGDFLTSEAFEQLLESKLNSPLDSKPPKKRSK